MTAVEDFLIDLDERWKGLSPVRLNVIGSTALFLQSDYVRATKDSDVIDVDAAVSNAAVVRGERCVRRPTAQAPSNIATMPPANGTGVQQAPSMASNATATAPSASQSGVGSGAPGAE